MSKTQLEINWGEAEPFRLIVQDTQDGEQLISEKNQETSNRAQGAAAQEYFRQIDN